MSFLGKLDRLVYATGFDKLLFMKVEPRRYRWAPLFVIAALVIGYVMMANLASRPALKFLLGWTLFYGAYLIAFFLRLFGPRFVATISQPLDERELMVKARAYAISGIAITGFAMLGCCYMPIAGLFGWWRPHMPNDWVSLALGIQAVAMLLPTLFASWIEPRAGADQED